MFENVTQEQILNEAETEFKKEFPRLSKDSEKYFAVDAYNANDMKTIFMDGFLAGMLWFRPALVQHYDGPKSELQIAVEKEWKSQMQNMVAKSKDNFDMEKYTKSVLRNV